MSSGRGPQPPTTATFSTSSADAPEEPNWLESGFRAIGGVLEGAGEAIWDLLTMVPFCPVNMVLDHDELATGELTRPGAGGARRRTRWRH